MKEHIMSKVLHPAVQTFANAVAAYERGELLKGDRLAARSMAPYSRHLLDDGALYDLITPEDRERILFGD
jgi:hypothetical protein